jgi:hypothetical protein
MKAPAVKSIRRLLRLSPLILLLLSSLGAESSQEVLLEEKSAFAPAPGLARKR